MLKKIEVAKQFIESEKCFEESLAKVSDPFLRDVLTHVRRTNQMLINHIINDI